MSGGYRGQVYVGMSGTGTRIVMYQNIKKIRVTFISADWDVNVVRYYLDTEGCRTCNF